MSQSTRNGKRGRERVKRSREGKRMGLFDYHYEEAEYEDKLTIKEIVVLLLLIAFGIGCFMIYSYDKREQLKGEVPKHDTVESTKRAR